MITRFENPLLEEELELIENSFPEVQVERSLRDSVVVLRIPFTVPGTWYDELLAILPEDHHDAIRPLVNGWSVANPSPVTVVCHVPPSYPEINLTRVDLAWPWDPMPCNEVWTELFGTVRVQFEEGFTVGYAYSIMNMMNLLGDLYDPSLYLNHLKDQAERIVNEIRDEPPTGEDMYMKGLALESEGKVDEAMICFKKAMKMDPHLNDKKVEKKWYLKFKMETEAEPGVESPEDNTPSGLSDSELEVSLHDDMLSRQNKATDISELQLAELPESFFVLCTFFLDCRSMLNLSLTQKRYCRLLQTSEDYQYLPGGTVWRERLRHQLSSHWVPIRPLGEDESERWNLCEASEMQIRRRIINNTIKGMPATRKKEILARTSHTGDQGLRLYLNASLTGWRLLYFQYPRIRTDGQYISNCSYSCRVRQTGNIACKDEVERANFKDVKFKTVTLYRAYQFIPASNKVLVLNSHRSRAETLQIICRETRRFGLGSAPSSPERSGVLDQVVVGDWSWVNTKDPIIDLVSVFSSNQDATDINDQTRYRLQFHRESNGFNRIELLSMALLNGTELETKEEHRRGFDFIADHRLMHLM